METVVCDWCKEETDKWIVAFDGRKICKEQDPCHKIGAHVNHTIRRPQ